jgi:hypothetical protein
MPPSKFNRKLILPIRFQTYQNTSFALASAAAVTLICYVVTLICYVITFCTNEIETHKIGIDKTNFSIVLFVFFKIKKNRTP